MKKYIINILTVTFLLLLSSCAVTEMVDNSAPFAPSVSANLEADVTVGEKITGVGSCTYLFGFIPLKLKTYEVSGVVPSTGSGGVSGMSLFSVYSQLFGFGPSTLAKGEAAYNAIKKNKCDVLVDPVYEMETTNFFFFKSQTATVTAYRGTVNSIEQIKN